MYTEDPGRLDEGSDTDTQLPVSLPLCTLKERQAGGSEVDGFSEGGGQVCFSEGLRHRLEEEEEQKVDEEEEEEKNG